MIIVVSIDDNRVFFFRAFGRLEWFEAVGGV